MNEAGRQLGPWRIERMLGRDMCGVHYAAFRDTGERATLYLLSGEPDAARMALLTWLVGLHQELSDPGLVRFRGLDQDGSGLYLIAEPVDGALTSLRGERRPAPEQIRALGGALAAALAAAHDRGVVHGGVELDNVLWAPDRGPRILGTGVAALGMGAPFALARGDVAALGRLLCALVVSGTAVDSDTFDAVRRLADPSTALSMREAHALLGGTPAEAAHGTGTAGTAALDHGPQDAARVAQTGLPTSWMRGYLAGESTIAAPRNPAAAVSPPAQLGGYLARYCILTRLGRGGMGEVFLAEDPALRRGVAIKRIRPGFEHDRMFRARLRREAQLVARLHHRAIVQVFDLVTDDDADHLVMEYVPGPSLRTLCAGGPIAVAEIVRIAAEVADGLAYAHEQGVIHRDLKLENILIGLDRQPKISDFGLARRAVIARDGTDQDPVTGEHFIVGTLRAMAPEQLQNHDVDTRADLFSLGIMLYELITGVSPFAADGDVETILRVLHHHPRPAHDLTPGVPHALSDLIDQLLDKDPARRPASAASVRDRLRDLDLCPRRRGESGTEPSPRPTAGASAAESLAAPPGAGERRQVTLLCIELAAAGRADDPAADPELLAGVLPAFRARVDEILARTDGILISALGHRFITCFGHPRPLEDAARRAVLAGRALRDAAAELRSLDPACTGVRFTATGAIHTGLAVAYRRGAGDELVLGDTLDTALRLLQLGGLGQLWLSGASARLVETEFQLEHPAALPEGVTSAHRFVGVSIVAATGSGEHDRPLVARDHEMQLLLGGWRSARQGQGQIALLIGEPGIGKSRLTRALAAAIAGDRPRRIAVRGSAHRQRSALEPVSDAIIALFPHGADADAARGAATDRIRAFTGPGETEQVLHFLGRPAEPLVGAPERARHQLLSGLRDVLIGTSHEVPTLLVVEDLHWLDPSTLDLIALIIQDVAASPLFLVMTTRPGFQPPWPATAPITQLHLGRLEAAAIETVITQACADRALPAAERAAIASRAEGVPLFAEELVRAALELGRAGEVPSTLRDALTARLHQLGPAATSVAHIAAVAGREFTADVIAAAGGLDRADAERELDRLVAVEILSRRRGRAREVLYQFGHVLLQQAAYEELLAADRRRLHGQLADVLLAEQRAGRDPGPELIANHLAGARRFDEAIASAHRAVLQALGQHARVEARELLRQALGWLDQLPESDARDRTEIELRMQLNAVLLPTEGYASRELERSCQRTEVLCKRNDDLPLPVKFGLFGGRLMRGTEDVAPLLPWFERVIERGGSAIERMIAHFSIGAHAYVRANYDVAYHHFERSMALFAPAEHAGVLQIYGGCGGYYSHIFAIAVLWKLGRFEDAWRHARATVAQAEALDPYSLGGALMFQMKLHIAIGDIACTEGNATRLHDIALRYEFPYLTCWALCGRGWALARRGQADRAMADLIAGTDRARQLGIYVWFPHCLGLLAESAILLGRFDHAERALEEALALCRTNIDRSHEPELLRLRGQLILGRDATAHAPAREAFSQALEVAQRHGGGALALRAATDLAELLRTDHRPAEAKAVLDPVYCGFAVEINDPNVAPARRLLAELAASMP